MTIFRPARLRSLLVVPILLAAAGCASPSARLAERERARDDAWRDTAARQAGLAPAPLSYADALASLREKNLELVAARHAVVSAEEQARQVLKDLLPGANLTASLSRSVTDLSNLARTDLAYAAFAYINVPGMVQLRLRQYSARLQLIRARWACELKERELTVQLREAFLRHELLAGRRRNLLLSLRWDAAASSPLAGLETDPRGIERESLLYALSTEADALQLALARLIGDDTRLWRPLPDDLPRLDYAEQPPDLSDAARYGGLFRRMQALDVEAAYLRERGVRLQFWPDLRVSLSSPPLYQNSGGVASSWDVDQVLFSANASMPLDLQGNIRRQLREARRARELQFAVMADQTGLALRRLTASREALSLAARRLRVTDLRIQGLRAAPLAQSPDNVRQNLDRLLRLDEQRTALALEQARLEHLFWIIDESRWPPPADL